MDTSTRAFQIDLYLEHLEEAAFLYEQRNALRKKPDFSWRAIADFEERLEAHIDALVVGGELALEICRKRAQEGEPGELFAATCVLCRQASTQGLAALLKGLDAVDPAQRQAIEDALKLELPEPWRDYCAQGIARQQGALVRVLTAVAGHRRIDISQHLRPPFDGTAQDCMTAAWSLGRIHDPGTMPKLAELAHRPEPDVRASVLVAMLRLGSTEALKPCYLLAQREHWPHIPMALAAPRAAIDVLLAVVSAGQATPETVLALGLLGDLRGVRPLQQALSNEPLASSAAWGLQLITGANLFGTTFVPDEVVEEELFAHELEAWRKDGKAPQRLDGKPFGTKAMALSCDPEAWGEWLKANAARFDAALRYRSGQPITPRTLFENLLDERMPMHLRQLVCEELCIRYECDIPLETDMPVRQQLRVLRGLSRWLEQHAQRFAAGTWYFAGQALL
jgi:uncharacterized protein (TIGR02270 family)